jgi:hypothetical protein
MAKTAAERRAARRRKEQSRARHRSAGQARQEEFVARRYTIQELVHAGARHAAGPDADEQQVEHIVGELARLDPDLGSDADVTAVLIGLLRAAWEQGWQPLDVAHVLRRQGTQRMARLATAAISREAQVAGAASRAPEEWLAQLAAVGAPARPDAAEQGAPILGGWRRAEGLDVRDTWRETLRLVGQLHRLPPLEQLTPPPSRWGHRARSRPGAARHSADARVLSRVRALLAKAESTDFPDEAEALSAKAQDLMSRHAIDAAVLDAEHGTSVADQVSARRVHIDNPYPEAKVQLLNAVARANGVRVIWLEPLAIATMVGLPFDMDLVDLLFTSLLVQATRAMSDAGRAGSRQTRSPSFRRAFLLSYAIRVGERLTDVRDQVAEQESASRGAALVPVLRERSQAVDDAFARMFPDTHKVESRVHNARGWHAGRLAAETADLGSGREQVSR